VYSLFVSFELNFLGDFPRNNSSLIAMQRANAPSWLMARLLDSINSPADVKKILLKQLPTLAREICEYSAHRMKSL